MLRLFPIFLIAAAPIFAQPAAEPFIASISKRVLLENKAAKSATTKERFAKFCDIDHNIVADRVLRMYGAMFVAADSVNLPKTCIFRDEEQVGKFQASVKTGTMPINGAEVKLQEAALNSLLKVIDEANQKRIRVSPFDGAIAASRSYKDSLDLWLSRYTPALNYWVVRGRITEADAIATNSLPVEKQVEKVIEWETQRLWFGTSHAASIFSSTAPPGASQHLSMLAFDVTRMPSQKLIAIFNLHGWFQTVRGDPQHFTFLGLAEIELPSRGLKTISLGGTKYWVPDIPEINTSSLQD